MRKPSQSHSATAAAHPNLALVKYWGYSMPALNLPANSSISITLSGATTTTLVSFDAEIQEDTLVLNGLPGDRETLGRVTMQLDRVRDLAGSTLRARVSSRNDFPIAAGMASSAAAFAALSLAATHALGLDLTPQELSVLARKGSGSACRSVFGGYVEWDQGGEDATSFAHQLYEPDYWDLRILTVAFPSPTKRVSSEAGHSAAPSSPYYAARLSHIDQTLEEVRNALSERDFEALGMAAEREARSLHAIAMTSQPEAEPWMSGITYVEPWTVRLIHAVQDWRAADLPVYFTLDAGPAVHLLCEPQHLDPLLRAVRSLFVLEMPEVWVSRPGSGAWLVNHQPQA